MCFIIRYLKPKLIIVVETVQVAAAGPVQQMVILLDYYQTLRLRSAAGSFTPVKTYACSFCAQSFVILVLAISAPYSFPTTNFHLDLTTIVVVFHSVVAAPVAVTTGSCPSHLEIAAGLRKILGARAQDFLNLDFTCSSSGCAPAVSLRFSRLHCLPDRHAVEFTSCSSAFVHSHSNHSDCPAGASLSTR